MVAAVAFENTVRNVDVIEHLGALWLVPIWHDIQDGTVQMPARLVYLSGLPHTVGSGAHDFVLTNPLPIEVLDWECVPKKEWGLIVLDPLKTQRPKNRTAN